MMNRFEKITESGLIWWAMNGIRTHMENLAYRSEDLRAQGKEEKAEEMKKYFLELRDQYYEIYFKLYDEGSHDIMKKSIEKLEDLGWGDLEK